MPVDEDVVKSSLHRFLQAHVPGRELHDEDDVFALGFVNSLFALQLVLFIESEFQVVVENEDLELDNFRSIQAMTQLVARKRGEPAL
jgi:acyl carrier protein